MDNLKIIWVFFVSAIVCSCATDIKSFVEVTSTPAHKSVFYFYRPNSSSNILIAPDIIINNEKVRDIRNDRYFYILTSPGEYNIQLGLADRYFGNHEKIVSIKPDEIIYFRISTELKFQKNKPYRRSFDIQRVTPKIAKSEIIDTTFSKLQVSVKAKNRGESAPLKIEKKGFSTSKSRNPFAN